MEAKDRFCESNKINQSIKYLSSQDGDAVLYVPNEQSLGGQCDWITREFHQAVERSHQCGDSARHAACTGPEEESRDRKFSLAAGQVTSQMN
jgi:hypothetical protein